MTNPAGHPYAMYNAIHSQLRSIDSTLLENKEGIEQLARQVEAAQSTTLVGIGSSLHAAQLSVTLWRELRPATNVVAEHSFDVANGLSNLRPEVLAHSANQHLVITLSHRGRKRYTLESLLMAHTMGARTCSITGKGVTAPTHSAHLHLTTVEQELSSAHTASLLGSFTISAAVIERISSAMQGRVIPALKEAISAGLSSERPMQDWAKNIPRSVRHLWIVGAGSDAVVAREIALKIKETSYIPSEGMSVEEFAHGPFQCVESSDQIIFIDTQPFASERIASKRAMAEIVGVPSLTVTTDQLAPRLESRFRVVALPTSTIRTLNSISALVSLQLFTYFLALERGTNPDQFRLEDPRFKAASNVITL